MQDTKINKVLKGIIKLSSIPLDETYGFKKRATDLLVKMNIILSDGEAATGAEKTLAVGKEKDTKKPAEKNGVKVDEAVKEAKGDTAGEKEKEVDEGNDEPTKEASKKEDIEMKEAGEKEAEGESEKVKVTEGEKEAVEASA